MIISIRRSLCVAVVAALPMVAGTGVAFAEGASAGNDRFDVDTNLNVTDTEDFMIEARVISLDDDGDASGMRTRITSSDVTGLEDVRADTRFVSSDDNGDKNALRAIFSFEDVSSLDDLDADVDLVTIDENNREGGAENNQGGNRIIGQEDRSSDDQQYREDAQYVFGK